MHEGIILKGKGLFMIYIFEGRADARGLYGSCYA